MSVFQTPQHTQTPQHVQDLNREDLIILGLEWSVNDAELKRYFEQFGEVAAAEVCVWVCVCGEYVWWVCVWWVVECEVYLCVIVHVCMVVLSVYVHVCV